MAAVMMAQEFRRLKRPKRKGRPRKVPPDRRYMAVVIPTPWHDMISALAADQGRTMSEVTRPWIEAGLRRVLDVEGLDALDD